MWTPGIELTTNERARNLRVAQCRAHAARISHQRRKAAKQGHVEQGPNTIVGGRRCQNTSCASVTNPPFPYQLRSWAQRHHLWLVGESLFGIDVGSETGQDNNGSHGVKASDLQLTWYSLVQKEPENHVLAVFDQEYQKRSFHLWTTCFSDRVAKYGVYCANVFFRIIPRQAQTSPMLRHMILAHSLACEHWKAHPKHAPSLSIRALHHYTQGLKAMYESRHDTHDFIAAIMMAFLLEARQNHHSRAAQHIEGYEKTIMNYQGLHDDEYRRLKGCYYTMRTYGEMWALAQPYEHTQEPWSVVDARNSIAHTIRQAEEYAGTRDPLQLHQLKVEVGKYLNADKDQYRICDLTLNQEAILLLLHVTVTILPSDAVGWLSSRNDMDQLNHLLSIAEAFLKQARAIKKAEEKELFATLAMLAKSVLRNVHDESCQQRAADLLQCTIVKMTDPGH